MKTFKNRFKKKIRVIESKIQNLFFFKIGFMPKVKQFFFLILRSDSSNSLYLFINFKNFIIIKLF